MQCPQQKTCQFLRGHLLSFRYVITSADPLPSCRAAVSARQLVPLSQHLPQTISVGRGALLAHDLQHACSGGQIMPATGLSIVRDDMTTTTRRATSMPPVADQRDPPNESTSTTGQSFLSRLAVVLQGSGRGSLSAPDRSPNSPLPMTSLASSDPDAASGEPRNSSGGSISVTGQSLCPQVSINLHGADPESQSTPNRSSSASQLVTSPASSGPTATGDQSPTSTSAAASMTLLEQDHPIGLSSSPNLSNQPSY